VLAGAAKHAMQAREVSTGVIYFLIESFLFKKYYSASIIFRSRFPLKEISGFIYCLNESAALEASRGGL
jgi:hypothetical protein